MTSEASIMLELDDIQAGALRSRPTPYAGAYILLRIDERRAGRELLRRLIPALDSAAGPADPGKQASLAAAISFQGLQALGVPQESLASFPPEFQQGMAARAADLGDVGENAPEHWEPPLGSPEVHLALAALAPDAPQLDAVLARAREALSDLPGVAPIWRLAASWSRRDRARPTSRTSRSTIPMSMTLTRSTRSGGSQRTSSSSAAARSASSSPPSSPRWASR